MLQQLQLLKLPSIKSQGWRMIRKESFFYNFCGIGVLAGFPGETGTF